MIKQLNYSNQWLSNVKTAVKELKQAQQDQDDVMLCLVAQNTVPTPPCENQDGERCENYAKCSANELSCTLFNAYTGMKIPKSKQNRNPSHALYIARIEDEI